MRPAGWSSCSGLAQLISIGLLHAFLVSWPHSQVGRLFGLGAGGPQPGRLVCSVWALLQEAGPGFFHMVFTGFQRAAREHRPNVQTVFKFLLALLPHSFFSPKARHTVKLRVSMRNGYWGGAESASPKHSTLTFSSQGNWVEADTREASLPSPYLPKSKT